MNNNTWNPIRRNRNIGTSKSGHGKDNKMVIPHKSNNSRNSWEDLTSYHAISRKVNEKEITFLIEPTKENYKYYCTVEDIVYLLKFIPEYEIDLIDLIIFRQPKRKEEILDPVWGRLAYWVRIDKYCGTAIMLEAQDINKKIYWDKSLKPDELKELERLQQDGFKITGDRRGYIIQKTENAIRETQLYRTLLHEIGHWVHYVSKVIYESIVSNEYPDDENSEILNDKYSKIPIMEKEKFANLYADVTKKRLINEGVIPFPRKHSTFDDEIINTYFY